MNQDERQATCSSISVARQEPMLGTAPRADVWLLLSHRGPFGARALEESDLPDRVKRHLKAELERIPHARLQLIKPDPAIDEDEIELFVVQGRELDPVYHRFELTSYDELLDLELESVVRSEPGVAGTMSREPLYLVCTNGRRDPCCAQFGLPVFQALQGSEGTRVRQSSHVGGHRFAANVLLFPHGLCYGRMQEDQVGEFLRAGQDGRLVLDRLRGRACYAPVVQAAEVLLRQEVGNTDLCAYRHLEEQKTGDNRWRIRFEDPGSGEIHDVSVESFTSVERDRVSCWSDKLAPVTTYALRSHAVGS